MSPEEEQWECLRGMQRAHHFELAARGLLDTALASEDISDIAERSMNSMTRSCVQILKKNDEQGDPVDALCIRFETPYENGKNELAQLAAPVQVAHLVPGTGKIFRQLNGFDSGQVAVVIRMAGELRQAREDGVLPNLKDSLCELDVAIPQDSPITRAA